MSDTIRKASTANHNTRKCDVCRRDRTKRAFVLAARVRDELALLAIEFDIEQAQTGGS